MSRKLYEKKNKELKTKNRKKKRNKEKETKKKKKKEKKIQELSKHLSTSLHSIPSSRITFNQLIHSLSVDSKYNFFFFFLEPTYFKRYYIKLPSKSPTSC